MGKGDIKSKKGKISAGSYGVSRKRKKTPTYVPKIPKVKKTAPVVEDETVKAATVAKKTATKKPAVKKVTAKKPAAKKAPAKKKPTAKK